MDKDQYIELFEEMGFYFQDRNRNEQPIATACNAGMVLRAHGVDLPSVYFNINKRGVYFVMRSEDWRSYSADLWSVIGPRKEKDNKPAYMTMIPREGNERAAFEQLMA